MNIYQNTPHFKHKLYLIRHGETEWSKLKKHTGRTDIPLTKLGEKEAIQLKPLLENLHFKKIYTSPLQRVLRTCELAGFLEDAEPSDDLLEFDYGDYEGLTTSDIRSKIPNWNFFDNGVTNGETFEEAQKRALHIIGLVAQIDGDVACFASGHISRLIGAAWIGLDHKCAQHLALSTASVSILSYEHEWRVIQTWNDTSHLNK
jgi:broad specificity phosphatase PhoE